MSGNTSTTQGGAIKVSGGTLSLTDVTLDGNSAAQAVADPRRRRTATLTGVTISNNTGDTNAGGIWTQPAAGLTLNLTNVTISGNTATGGSGGGLYIAKLANLTNITVNPQTPPARVPVSTRPAVVPPPI